MPSTVTLSKITEHPSGKRIVSFSDGSALEFESVDDMKAAIGEVDSNEKQAKLMLIGWWLARHPDATQANTVEGKTLTFDCGSPSMIQVN